MGFSSMDDFLSEVTVSGKFYRADWNKLTHAVTAQAAGAWYQLFSSQGNPTAGTISGGTNLAFQALTDASVGAILHGGNVTTDTKHILNVSAFSASATTMPAVFMLVDMLGFYPVTTVTTTGDQALNNTVTLPRYTDGAGVQAFVTATTAMGATAPNIRITYTDSDANTGNLTPGTLPIGNASAPIGQIVYSGTGTGKYGPFLPLAAGDKGIRSVQQFNLASTYTSGALSLNLCKPLLTLPMTTLGVAAERDLMNQLPSLPRIYDGACLAWLMYAGAATPVNSAFFGHCDFGWG